MTGTLRPIHWVGSSKDDLRAFPDDVQDVMGYALELAQRGTKHPDAKPLKGFGGASVLEIIDDYDGDTYRTMYTVRLRSGIYVLHAFQKKSKRGSEMSRHESDLIRARLRAAVEQDALRTKKGP
ncbi:MAG: type II toxin-antitoxin system RelE/ParE family toxin [Thermomicrobiales bacterium]